MQRRSNINFNSIGMAGCFLLAGVIASAISPVTRTDTFAQEATSELATTNLDKAYQISTVGLTFTPTTADATVVMPVDTSNGAKNHVEVGANVNVTSSGGYDIWIGSNSPWLKKDGNSTEYYIEPVEGADVAYDDITINRWAYAFNEKDAFNYETARYNAMPGTERGKKLRTVSNSDLDDGAGSADYTLSFAANIGADKPAGTYSNTVTLSVVSSPQEITNIFGVKYMQDLTAGKCNSSSDSTIPIGSTAQLKDNRDEKSYWVTKMPDGHCWMVQNLDLDLPGTAISSTSNQKIYNGSQMADTKSPSWTPTKATQTTVSSSTVSDTATDSISWDQGLFVVKDPTTTTSCTGSSNANINSGTDCNDYFQNVTGWTASDDPEFTKKHSGKTFDADTQTYDAHYLVGNWYSWNAATAGTGTASVVSTGSTGAVTSESNFQDASSSICPKGWRLPTSGRNASSTTYATAYDRDNSFKRLIKFYNPNGSGTTTGDFGDSSSDVTKNGANVLGQPPLFFVRSGYVRNAGHLLNSGGEAYYWSSTAYTGTGGSAYDLYFRSATNVQPSNDGTRSYGLSVRCLTQ